MQHQHAHDLNRLAETEERRARVLSIEELRSRIGVAPPPDSRNETPPPMRPRIVWRREDAHAE